MSITGEQQSQACIVAQHRVNAAVRRLLACAVDEPGRVGFGSDWLPDFLLQVVGNRPANRIAEYEAEHLGLGRSVVELGTRRHDAHVIRSHRFNAAGTNLPKGVGSEPGYVVLSRVRTPEDKI